MKTSSVLPWRHTIRLQDFDYASAALWHITICARDHRPLFGAIKDGDVALNALGSIAADAWVESATVRPEIVFDEWILMPDHLHGILYIPDSGLSRPRGSALLRPPRSLGSFVAGYKSAVTGAIRRLIGDPTFEVWQYKYFDEGIRSMAQLERVRQYIRDNPKNWVRDRCIW
ncbi:MAG TPA: transposase [Thermoanaerobaculia bacterium]|nr:transposase [Thermoanaerobaculia bacterium]